MKKSPISTWQIYALGIAMCAAFSAALWLCIISPALANSQREANTYREAAERHRQWIRLAAELNASGRQTALIQQTLERDKMRLAPASFLNERLGRLTDLAATCGLVLDEIRPGKTVDAGPYKTTSLRINGSGNYPQFVRFLHRLHENYPDMGLQLLDLGERPATGAPATPSLRVELIWYTKK